MTKLVKPAYGDPQNSVDLFDADRLNKFGEMYCIAPAILSCQVKEEWGRYEHEAKAGRATRALGDRAEVGGEMRNPEFRKCSDNDPNHEHIWLDHCWVCAPWWDQYPICPDCKIKLRQGKKVDTCPRCRKRYVKTADQN